MDKSIEQMGQDLARAGYAKSTRHNYLEAMKALSKRFGKPVDGLTREELREFADATVAESRSSSSAHHKPCALLFLYRKTLGSPPRRVIYQIAEEIFGAAAGAEPQ